MIAMPDWFPNISRALSLVIALIYLGLACFSALSAAKLIGNLLIFGSALLLPLACIWYGDELGEYLGPFPSPGFNRKSPGWMVKLGGWLLLLMPVILFLFIRRV
jgi:hypothetical protein